MIIADVFSVSRVTNNKERRMYKSHIFMILLAVFLAACSAETGNAPPAESEADIEQPIEEAQVADEEDEPETQVTDSFPVTITNCGLDITVEAPPQQAVTLNQSATEVMLALGLQDRMVGTAYIDDEILPVYADAYENIPVLAEEYPAQEILFATDPDFIYGGFSSAFGEDVAGDRSALAEQDIASYLSPSYCEDENLRPEAATIETTYQEIRDVAALFGVSDRAEALIAEMQATLDEVQESIADVEETPSVFWYDSGDPPFVGACCGGPGMIMDLAGSENIFEDIEGNFGDATWEAVVERDADYIVLIEADWSTSQEKIDLLESNPAYSGLTAVQEQNYIIIPFSYTILGVRNADAVQIVAEGLYPERFE